jgi:iron(III) transport system ATP-binding protein
VGTAESLYRQPASVFVARFLGRANLIEAAVKVVSAGRVDVTIAGQPHAVHGSDLDVRPGESALAIVRPEAIEIAAPSGGLEGKVVARTYLGEKMEYDIEVAGQRLQIVRFNPPPSERFAPGDTVTVRLPNEGVQLLPAEGA